jgi:hypothetical protein
MAETDILNDGICSALKDQIDMIFNVLSPVDIGNAAAAAVVIVSAFYYQLLILFDKLIYDVHLYKAHLARNLTLIPLHHPSLSIFLHN